MCIRDSLWVGVEVGGMLRSDDAGATWQLNRPGENPDIHMPVSYTHLRAHETVLDLVCRLLLEKQKTRGTS